MKKNPINIKKILTVAIFLSAFIILISPTKAFGAVAFDASSESHTGTTGSTAQTSFSWTHTPVGVPKGVLIFVWNDGTVAETQSITYGGVTVPRVTGATAVDSATETGRMSAFFLGSNIPTGAQTVVVNRNNTATELWAVAITVTAASATGVYEPGIILLEDDQAFALQSVTDGTSASNSLRFAGTYSGLNTPPTAGTGSTLLQNFDSGNFGGAVVRETTAGIGARNVGFSGTSDDVAAVHLAVREVSVPTVTTQSASSVTGTSATLNGNITAIGGTYATIRGFAWGTNSSLSGGDTATTSDTTGGFNTGAFTDTSLTLTCGTTYYSRAYATNWAGTSYGAISSSFTTSGCPPTVTTQSASSVTATAATLNGNITSVVGGSATVRGFAWGTNASLSGGDTATTTDTTGQPFGAGVFTESSLTLVCETTYYARAYATNANGTGYGAISSSFTTSACPSATFNQSNYRIFASSTPGNGDSWLARSAPESTSWLAVAYGNGVFVGVANSGTNRIMYSPDGVTWKGVAPPVANAWSGITFGNGLFVAVSTSGAGNRVMTSPDGINWTIRSNPADRGWLDVTYGNGVFVAVASAGGTAGQVMTSPDGITWTSQSSSLDVDWYSIKYGNGTFVAVGTSGGIMTSTDGTSWTTQTSPTSSWWHGLTYGNGKFVAVAYSGSSNVITSTDGITWDLQTASEARWWSDVAYGNGKFVAISNDPPGSTVMTSPDGITWTSQTPAEDNQWFSIAYGNGMFVSVGYSGTNRIMTSGSILGLPLVSENTAAALSAAGDVFKLRQGIDIGDTSIAAGARSFKLQYAEKSGSCDASFTGETYYDIDYKTPISFSYLFENADNLFPVASTSTDPSSGLGNTYQSYQTKELFNNSSSISISDTGIWEFILKDNDAPVGNSYCLRAIKTATSTSAVTWTARTAATDSNWTDIAYGEGIFVAVGTNDVMTSPDGITWTSQTPAANESWTAVIYGNGTFVAVAGTNNAVMTSPDGITWTSQTGVINSASVTYGNGLFVAVAANAVMTSPDGTTWTARTPAAANSWSDVTYGNNTFVAVATNGSGTVNDRFMSSPDGITWTARTAPANVSYGNVTYGMGLFVASPLSASVSNRIATSPDGMTWTAQTIPTGSNQWRSITYGNGLFVGGTSSTGAGIVTSPDGINWTTKTPAAANGWVGIAYGKGTYVAISPTGTGTINDRVMTASSTDSLLDSYSYIPEVTTFNNSVTTTLGDGTDPANKTLAPGDSATSTDAFTFVTSTGTDTITDITVTLGPANAYLNVATTTITNAEGVERCSLIATSTNVLNFTGCNIAISTSATTSLIMITPKTHANMPAVPGASYATVATVTGWTGTNTHAGTDTDSATVTIDNLSPVEVTGASVTPGNTQNGLAWTNPVDADYSSTLVLRRASSAVTDVPVEGTTYATTTAIGSSVVACVGNQTSCTDTDLSNGTAYHYKIFALDSRGNYSGTGVVPTGSPAIPATSPTVTTQSASSVTQTSATLNGNITSTGGASAAIRGFAWGTNSSLSGGDTATTTENGTFGTGAFTNSSLTLVCNTTYYSRAYATNSVGTSVGSISASFTTTACAPTVTTQAASSVGQTSATLNGNITVTGGSNATTRGFAWGTSSTMEGDTATTTEGGSFSTGAFTNSSLTFVCNTTYYSRAYATHSGGTGLGSISASFTTSSCPSSSGNSRAHGGASTNVGGETTGSGSQTTGGGAGGAATTTPGGEGTGTGGQKTGGGSGGGGGDLGFFQTKIFSLLSKLFFISEYKFSLVDIFRLR